MGPGGGRPGRGMTLTRAAVRDFYDRFGARQDAQGWYEDRALAGIISQGRFAEAEAVLELGCGTGRLAERLLAGPLPADASYLGLDLSTTMVGLAAERLAPFDARVRVARADITEPVAAPDGAFDRIVATYVFDILSAAETRAVLAEARRLLKPGGLLCAAGLTWGRGPLSWPVARLWQAVWRVAPARLGGCRPVRLADYLDGWRIAHRAVIVQWGIASEVVVAGDGQ